MLNKVEVTISIFASDCPIKIKYRTLPSFERIKGFDTCVLCNKKMVLNRKGRKAFSLLWKWTDFHRYSSTGFYLCSEGCVKLFQLGYAEYFTPRAKSA